jgi:hypothetical protein
MKFINENMYLCGRVQISCIFDGLLCEFLGLTPAINVTIFFCKANFFLLLDVLTPKMIPYYMNE